MPFMNLPAAANPGVVAQPQTQGGPGQAAPWLNPQQQQDPKSQYLASALAQMRQQPQQSAQGLGENLLASALAQYGMNRRAQQNGPASGAAGFNPSALGADGSWTG